MKDRRNTTPPSSANWLASKFIDERLLEEFYGDLEEIYEDRIESKSKFYAKLMYWVDVLHLLIGFSSIRLFRNNPTILYRHYLLAGSRNLLRNKVYSAINILGLAVGMGVCLLIYQYVHFELSYDGFHKNAETTYRLEEYYFRNGEMIDNQAYTTYGLGPATAETIPEVLDYTRIHPQNEGLVVKNSGNDKMFQENHIWYVDSNFLQMFDFPLMHGNSESVFSENNNIVLTEKMASKYFGSINPVGEILEIKGGTLSGNFIVTGVLSKLPANSHLKFDFLLPMDFLLQNWGPYREHDDGWYWHNFVTYINIEKQANFKNIANKTDQIIRKHADDNDGIEMKIKLMSLMGIHLKSESQRELRSDDGNNGNIRIFSTIGIFLLIIAWINYINLATARAIQRAKEVGIRKSIGAYRNQLMGQFMIESVLTNFLAALFSIVLAFCMFPIINYSIGANLELNVLYDPEFWTFFFAALLFGTLLSGIYPSFVLSAYKPISIFDSFKARRPGGLSLRRGLITFQFFASVLLISGTYLIYNQINYMKSRDLGVDMKKIIVLNGPRTVLELDKPEQKVRRERFYNDVISHHLVTGIPGMGMVPSVGFNWRGSVWRHGEPKDQSQDAYTFFIDSNFSDVYDLEFLW